MFAAVLEKQPFRNICEINVVLRSSHQGSFFNFAALDLQRNSCDKVQAVFSNVACNTLQL